jgi:hypothetical protein
VISLVVDSLLYTATDGSLDILFGLIADAIAIGALFMVAWLSEPVRRMLKLRRIPVISPSLSRAPSAPSSTRGQ